MAILGKVNTTSHPTRSSAAATRNPPRIAWRVPRSGLRRAPRSTIVCCSAHGNVQQHDQEEAPQTRAMLCRALADLREHLDTPQGKGHKDAQKVVDWFEVKMQSPKRDMEFERAVGTLLAAGNVDNLLRVVATLKHTEERQIAGEPGPWERQAPSEGQGVGQSPNGHGRDAQLIELFNKLDTQKTGYLTLTAFFNGLEMLREHMTDEELENVGSSMDGQGRVSLEQFLAVVAMAEQDKGSRDAAFLHHLTHMKPSDSPVDKFM